MAHRARRTAHGKMPAFHQRIDGSDQLAPGRQIQHRCIVADAQYHTMTLRHRRGPEVTLDQFEFTHAGMVRQCTGCYIQGAWLARAAQTSPSRPSAISHSDVLFSWRTSNMFQLTSTVWLSFAAPGSIRCLTHLLLPAMPENHTDFTAP